jgi:Na+/H+-dicarboxylate symporter
MKLNLITKIVIGIAVGIVLGLYSPMPLIKTLSSVGFVLGQYIKFIIPLLIIAFVAKGIADYGQGAGHALIIGLILAYTSTIAAELLTFFVGSFALVHTGIVSAAVAKAIPITPYLKIEIPTIMPIMSALVFAIVLGLGITWIKAKEFGAILEQFNAIITILIRRGLLPVFPFFIATVFMEITAKGQLIPTAMAFLQVILLIIPLQWFWLLVLYTIAAIYTRRNSFPVLVKMLPAYFTAMGTMSSAATLPVALDCAHKVPFFRKETVNFCIPLFNVAHLPGAAMAITMSAMTVLLLTKGQLPTIETFLPFILLLGLIEVAAVGVPGGSVAAALGILELVLGFDQTSLGLMVALFMIQDSFGTATNVTGDAALTMIMNKAIRVEEVPIA